MLIVFKKFLKTLALFGKIGYNNKVLKRTEKSRNKSYSLLVPKVHKQKKEELMAKIEEKVEQLVKDPIEKLGYSLYDVEYVKEGPEYYLRIYIDKESGIDLNDCEKVSNEINEILDKADYIKEQYYLEVSSPGIERKLRKDKHLEQNISKNVEIKLFKKDNNGKKEYTGKLKAFNQEEIIIETDKEITIERKNIAQIKTIYEW